VDGGDYSIFHLQDMGEPMEIVYAAEGSPLITGPAAIMKNAPNPNAARLYYGCAMRREGQQLNSVVAGLRSAHALVTERKSRRRLAEIKLMQEDPAAVEAQSAEIKAKYTAIFGV
jgi:iron(III) transport system substrate-binding protein